MAIAEGSFFARRRRRAPGRAALSFTNERIGLVVVGRGPGFAVERPAGTDPAATNATAAAITSAMNINFAACALNNHAAGGDCLQVDNCDDAASVLQNGLPAGYTVTAAPIAAPNGTAASCTIARANVAGTTTFTGVRAGMP